MRRQGYSYSEIQRVVEVPTSTLSQWLKDLPLTEDNRIAIEQRKVAGRARTVEALRGRRMARQGTSARLGGRCQEQAVDGRPACHFHKLRPRFGPAVPRMVAAPGHRV